jgi:hypothetical protein
VAGQAFHKFEAHAFDASLLTGTNAVSGLSPSVRGASEYDEEADWPSVSRMEGIRSVRGILMAIALEAAAAICLYCIWRIWHLFR